MLELPKGCRLKVQRARVHSQDLEGWIRKVFKGKPEGMWRLRKEYQPSEACFVLFVDWIREMPVEWGLLLGDAVHNLRSALDHLAWGLVLRGREPNPRKPRMVQFPIHDEILDYEGRLNQRLPGVPLQHTSIIEEFQPYHSRPVADAPLHLLRELSNDDKHRMLTLIDAYAQTMTWRMDPADFIDCTYNRTELADGINPIRVGTELGRVYVTPSSQAPELKIRTETWIQPALSSGHGATFWLERICTTVSSILDRFARLP